MVYVCVVLGCTHRRTKEEERSFHSFPLSDPERCEHWIRNVSRENDDGSRWAPSKYSRICSDHFLPTDYAEGTLIKTLKTTAIPTQFPSYPSHKQPRQTSSRPTPTLRGSLMTDMSISTKAQGDTSSPKQYSFFINEAIEKEPTGPDQSSSCKRLLEQLKTKVIGDPLQYPVLSSLSCHFEPDAEMAAKEDDCDGSVAKRIKTEVNSDDMEREKSHTDGAISTTEFKFSSDHTLEDFRKLQEQFIKDRNWHQFHSPRNVLLAMVGEVGELAEIFQWRGEVSEGLPELNEKEREHVGQEMSDVFLYLLDLSVRCRIDLPTAVLAKMKGNAKKYPVSKSFGQANKYTDYQT